MKDVQIISLQKTYVVLTKELQDKLPVIYNKLLIICKAYALKDDCCKVTKVYRAGKSGTKMTLRPIRDAEEYKQEIDKLIEEVKELGVKEV